MKTFAEIKAIVDEIQFKDWKFRLEAMWIDDRPEMPLKLYQVNPKGEFIPGHHFFLQVRFLEKDAYEDIIEPQSGRKWLISPHMTKSEIVQTAFKAVLTAVEHEVRDAFKYKGELVFCPHFDVDELIEIHRKRKLDAREPVRKPQVGE
jgi:hypothetical protein